MPPTSAFDPKDEAAQQNGTGHSKICSWAGKKADHTAHQPCSIQASSRTADRDGTSCCGHTMWRAASLCPPDPGTDECRGACHQHCSLPAGSLVTPSHPLGGAGILMCQLCLCLPAYDRTVEGLVAGAANSCLKVHTLLHVTDCALNRL